MTTTNVTQDTPRLVNIYLAFHAGTGRFDGRYPRDIVRGTGAYGVLEQALDAAARTPACIGILIDDVRTGEVYAAVVA